MESVLKKPKKKIKAPDTFGVIVLILLSVYTLSIILLLLWGVFTSLKTQSDFRSNVLGLPSGMPWEWAWSNMTFVFKNYYVPVSANGIPIRVGLPEMILNTFLYAGGGALIQTFVPCFVAYATAKFDYKFSKIIYSVVIVTMILPIVGATASEFQLLRAIGLYDSILGNWIQKFNFIGMYFLIFHATFKSMAKDFSEAAYVDGASEARVLFSIMLPLVKTVLFTVFLIRFIDFWNDYQIPLLYLPSHPTISYGIYWLSITNLPGFNVVPIRMAGCMLLLIPILILFIFFNNRIMTNISLGGLKE